MFDLHVQHVITNGVRYFKADRRLFDPLFPHVSEAYKARMFERFSAVPINIDAAFNVKTTKDLPLLVVDLSETRYDAQGIGIAGNADYTQGIIGYTEVRSIHEFHSQRVNINIYVGELELMRVLHQVVKASMMLFTKNLLQAGYQNVLYEGTNSLLPEPELKATGDLVVYGRQCTYSALHLLEIPYRIEDITNIGAIEPIIDVQVQSAEFAAEDLPSGVAGGVVLTN